MTRQNTNSEGRNSVFFDLLDRLSTFIFSNLMWMALTVTIPAISFVTLPLATVGLFHVMSLWTRGKEPEFFKDFFGAIRRYWWKALLIGLIDLGIGALIVANLMILSMMDFDNPLVFFAHGITILVVLMLLMTNMYIWSLLVVAELSLRAILELSLKLVFANPLQTVGTLIAGALPLVLGLILPLPALLWLVGIVSLSALIINWGTWRVIRRYIPTAELLEYESQD